MEKITLAIEVVRLAIKLFEYLDKKRPEENKALASNVKTLTTNLTEACKERDTDKIEKFVSSLGLTKRV